MIFIRCITESKEKDQKQTTLLQIESLTDSNIPYVSVFQTPHFKFQFPDFEREVETMGIEVLGRETGRDQAVWEEEQYNGTEEGMRRRGRRE